MIAMPMAVEHVFDGFVRDRFERRLNLGAELHQLRIHEEDAIVTHESSYIALPRLSSRALKDVDIT